MIIRTVLLTAIVCVAISILFDGQAAEWYVDGSVAQSGDGQSPETAFQSIQEGIAASVSGDTVFVAEETYLENINFKGKNIVVRSNDPLDPEVVANTIIDGNYAGPVVTFEGPESEGCVLSGFTIQNGNASSGGGICGGSMTHATIEHNVIRGNTAPLGEGGGLYFCGGIIRNNTIANNIASGGGGLSGCHGIIQNNVIANNSARTNGGGLCWCEGTIQNNLIVNNAATWGGGLYSCSGTIRNNTITGNSAQTGGGLHDCGATISNCIIWGDLAPYMPELSMSSYPTYSCIGNWDRGGEGNISACPHFVAPRGGDYHLRNWSPCIDAGHPGSDFSREPLPNGGRINMGAFGNTAEAASASPDTDGDLLPDDWEMLFFADLRQGPDDDTDTDRRSNLEEYRDGTTPVWAGTWYVAASVTDSGDGTSWETAFKTIQEGMDAAWEGETVLVAAGLYVENVHFEGKNITVRSTDPGAPSVVAETIIDGGQTGSVVTFVGSETAGCALSGFTIRNGRATSDPPHNRGGGIRGGYQDYPNRALIENNVVTNNSAWDGGGLVYCGGTIRNNVITGNSAQDDGGGLHRCSGIVESNRIIANAAGDHGGAIAKSTSTIRHNLICGNSAGDQGGAMRDCDGAIESNTIADNTALYGDALALCDGAIHNCIIWGGSRHGPQLYRCSMPAYCCIDRWKLGGPGNIPYEPYFVDADNGDYHLQSYSPCIDAGDPASAFSEEPELNGGRINMGVYGNTPEAASKSPDSDGDQLPDDWEVSAFGDLGESGSGDHDGDLMSNLKEYHQGSNPSVPPSTWYVDASVSASGDGTSPATAFQAIQEAIEAASDADMVIVSPGVYFENVRFNGKNVTLHSTNPYSPAVVASTIIDGKQLGSVVTYLGSEDETCVLAGFTIRNGSGMNGGGICGGTDDCGTYATIHHNSIVSNSAAAYWDDDRRRWIGGYGGGVAFCHGLLSDNTISNNLARQGGGGLSGCDGALQNNTISENSAYNDSPEGARADGGGMHDCDGVIQNNLADNNSAQRDGGGLSGCDGTIQNNTVTDNTAGNDGGGMSHCAGIIRNCIIWGNVAQDSGDQVWESNVPSFCCIEDWTDGGEVNIAEDPDFVDDLNGDYHLQATSFCIDAGANFYWFAWPQRDLDGKCRLVGARVDMGCYEWGATADADGDLLCDLDEMGGLTDVLLADTDSDGLRDGLEVLRGTNPLVATPASVVGVPADVPTIQQALCLAVPGDEIIVSPDTYEGNVQFCGTDVTLRSWDPEDPDTVASTVLDGGEMTPVVSFAGCETPACLLSGFTIRNGRGDHGSGIRGGKSDLHTRATIRNNTITDNHASGSGGGVAWCDGTIANNVISNNDTSWNSGGLSHCHGTIQFNTIAGNQGGLFECDGTIHNNAIVANLGTGLYSCQATIQANVVTANYNQGLSSCCGSISHNTIVGNAGPGLGDCDGTIRNNLIVGNFASRGGGLVECDGTIQNNTIAMNAARYDGGALDLCNAVISNCILFQNSSPGRQVSQSSDPTYSCIPDSTPSGKGNIAEDPLLLGLPFASGRWTAAGTFDEVTWQTTLVDAGASWEPNALVGLLVRPVFGWPSQFVIASNSDNTITVWGDASPLTRQNDLYDIYDFRLSASSPCIDAGINEDWMWEATDLDGSSRIVPGGFSATVDMGAYEYVPQAFTLFIVKEGPAPRLVWSSQLDTSYVVWSCLDLSAAVWNEEATVPSDGNATSWTDPDTASHWKFYRIEEK